MLVDCEHRKATIEHTTTTVSVFLSEWNAARWAFLQVHLALHFVAQSTNARASSTWSSSQIPDQKNSLTSANVAAPQSQSAKMGRHRSASILEDDWIEVHICPAGGTSTVVRLCQIILAILADLECMVWA